MDRLAIAADRTARYLWLSIEMPMSLAGFHRLRSLAILAGERNPLTGRAGRLECGGRAGR